MKVISNKGEVVDFSKFDGNTIATGNAGQNARGDVLGKGGAIVRTREQVANDYYRDNPRAVTSYAPLHSIEDEVLSPADAVAAAMAVAPAPLGQTGAPEVPAPKRKRQAVETED